MYSVKECGAAVYLFIYLNPIEHWNYLGVDETLGPVAVSLRREKLDDHKEHGPQYNYRVIFRTSEVSIHNRDFFFFSFYFSESVFVTSFGLRPSGPPIHGGLVPNPFSKKFSHSHNQHFSMIFDHTDSSTPPPPQTKKISPST